MTVWPVGLPKNVKTFRCFFTKYRNIFKPRLRPFEQNLFLFFTVAKRPPRLSFSFFLPKRGGNGRVCVCSRAREMVSCRLFPTLCVFFSGEGPLPLFFLGKGSEGCAALTKKLGDGRRRRLMGKLPKFPFPVFPDGGSRQGEICESGGCRDGFFSLSGPLSGLYHETHIPYTLMQISIFFLLNTFPPIKATPSPETGAKEILIVNGRFRGEGGGRARMKHTSNFPSR